MSTCVVSLESYHFFYLVTLEVIFTHTHTEIYTHEYSYRLLSTFYLFHFSYINISNRYKFIDDDNHDSDDEIYIFFKRIVLVSI